MDEEVVRTILGVEPEKIIYVSCNPSTLKRDIELLDNYTLKEISAFNMFPGTSHIECVTLLERT